MDTALPASPDLLPSLLPGGAAPERTRWMEHRGRRVLLVDYSGLRDTAVLLREIRHTGQVVQAQPHASVLGLTDVRGCVYSWAVLHALKDLMRGNRPHVLAAATVLDRPELRVALDALVLFTGRTVHVFPTREQALDWLADQPG
jgi:hypothetical protein